MREDGTLKLLCGVVSNVELKGIGPGFRGVALV